MKLTRRAAQRIQLIVATRVAEKEPLKLNYDSLFAFPVKNG